MNPVAAMHNLNQLRERPELVVWSMLFAIGAALLLSGLQQAGRRPDLAERLARLDDNARFAHAVRESQAIVGQLR